MDKTKQKIAGDNPDMERPCQRPDPSPTENVWREVKRRVLARMASSKKPKSYICYIYLSFYHCKMQTVLSLVYVLLA